MQGAADRVCHWCSYYAQSQKINRCSTSQFPCNFLLTPLHHTLWQEDLLFSNLCIHYIKVCQIVIPLTQQGSFRLKKTSGLPFLCLLYFLSFRYLFLVLFFHIKNNSMLACRVVCCSYQSDRRIWVCISHQSDCRLKVRISDQSYHSIWIWCINQSVIGECISHQWYHSFLTNDVMKPGGCAQRMT